ncbi:MAG TPA: sigma-54-dependent Fis family transcriptional regulator [Bacteroidales bacterium]|nr:sigma-54-dependent Fis family transcriptional regulator [Bacteroidales bacterium]
MQGQILIVEDDSAFGTMLLKWFGRNGYTATLCSGMMSAQNVLSQKRIFDLILSDLKLADGDGIMLLSWLKKMRITTPVIIMTGYGEVQTAVSAIKLGAFDFLEKPINPSILTKKIQSVFDQNKSNEESSSLKIKNKGNRNNNKDNSKIVEGTSPLYRQMYSFIDLVAPTQMGVMIIGESGTGKEHVAHMIHNRSNRAQGPFIAVDCGSLSTELAPSELFGHKKGSFTSAIDDKNGFFWEANGGTLFLDEVGNLPYGVQTQMLRSLQEKKIRPIGTSTDIEVDVRIITATNENLEQAILQGKFREDLYHRLNEFLIKVPALRDCIEDIALYAQHFMDEASNELEKDVNYLSPEALKLLENYSWPGNLRELRNVVRRSVLFTTGDTITSTSLPSLSGYSELPNSSLHATEIKTNSYTTDLEASYKSNHSLYNKPEDERDKILKALHKSNGNKTKAAKLLNIDRKTLYNKIHLYNIEL